jgi:YHS domain-containing protein
VWQLALSFQTSYFSATASTKPLEISSNFSENEGFSTMGLPCMQCNESFSTRHTFESAVYDEGVYYFCGIECMEMWMSANAQEIEREKQQ